MALARGVFQAFMGAPNLEVKSGDDCWVGNQLLTSSSILIAFAAYRKLLT